MSHEKSSLDTQQWQGDNKPATQELARDFEQLEHGMDGYQEAARRNADTRHARWSGQSRDFRKHGAPGKVFPWDGASDIQDWSVDELVNEDVALALVAMWESEVAAHSHKPSSAADAFTAAQYMRYIMENLEELDDQAELAFNNYFEGGIFAMGTFWKEETALQQRKITLQEIAEFDNQLFILISDPNTQDEAILALQQLFPRAGKPQLRKAVKELRDSEDNSTILRLPVVIKARPFVRTFIMGEDILIPPETQDGDQLSRIHTIEYLEPATIRGRVHDEGWDEKWAEDVIERGKGIDNFPTHFRRRSLATRRFGIQTRKNLVKVVTTYQYASDKNGVPGWYYTVYSPHLPNNKQGNAHAAKNELLNFQPSRHPFTIGALERTTRRILDARGYGETARSAQNQLKIEQDSQIDNSGLSTVPTIEYISGTRPPEVGPGRKNAVRRKGSWGYVETPPSTNKSRQVEIDLRNHLRRRFGRATPDSDPTRTQAMNRRLIKRCLGFIRRVMINCWQLEVQFGKPETHFQVLGNQGMQVFQNNGHPFDFTFTFDTRKLDNADLLEEYKTIGDIAAKFDQKGEVNTSELLRGMLAAINPMVAQRVLQPPEVAQQEEIKEEMKMLEQMFAGFDVDVPESNINAPLRLQIVQGWIQGSENIPARDIQQRLQSDESFGARIQKHVQQLQFVITQQENATIGRLGTAPGNAPTQIAAPV